MRFAPFPFRHKDRQLVISDVLYQDNQVGFSEFFWIVCNISFGSVLDDPRLNRCQTNNVSIVFSSTDGTTAMIVFVSR